MTEPSLNEVSYTDHPHIRQKEDTPAELLAKCMLVEVSTPDKGPNSPDPAIDRHGITISCSGCTH